MKNISFEKYKINFSQKWYRLSNLIVVFAILFLPFLFSCSFVQNNYSYRQENGLSVIIKNYQDFSSSNYLNNARTVSPGTCSYSEISYYTVTGQDYEGVPFQVQNITISENNGVYSGKINTISKSIWNLVLHAYNSNDEEMLRGYATVDTNAYDTVAFTLSTDGVSTQGSYSLHFKYANSTVFTDMVGQISIYLKNQSTSEELAVASLVKGSSSTNDLLYNWISEDGYLLSSQGIDAGTYLLKVFFYQSIAEGDSQQIGFYSDILDIQPGRETAKTITISDIIARKPNAAPSNVKVYRMDSSLNSEYYNAVIRWQDNSTNEEFFKIKFRRYDTDSKTLLLEKTIDKRNYSSLSYITDGIGYVGGALHYGSSEYILRLKTGELYDIEMCSSNSYGDSAYVSRVSSATVYDSDYGKLTGFSASSDPSEEPQLRVNTLSIVYNLCGGKWQVSAGVAYSEPQIEYKIYDGSTIYLTTPKTITDPDNLYFTTQTQWPVSYYSVPSEPWQKWVYQSAGTEVSYFSVPMNVNVNAVYSVSQSIDELYFDNSVISITYGSGTNAVNANLPVNSQVTVTVDRTSLPNSRFTSFDFYVNGVSQEVKSVASTENSISYIFTVPFKGSYKVQVSGCYNEQYFFSQEFTFKVSS